MSQSTTMGVSDNRRLRDLLAGDKVHGVSDYCRLRDLAADEGSPAAGADDGTHRHHNPAGAGASATCSGSDPDSLPAEAAKSAAAAAAPWSWQPLPRSVPKRRCVGTKSAPAAVSNPTTGSAAPPRHTQGGPTEARHQREAGQNNRMSRRDDLVGDGAPKPSMVSHVAHSARQKALQKEFIKWWLQGNPPVHTTRLPHARHPPPPQSNQDASHTPPPPAEPEAEAEASKGCQQGLLALLAFTAAVIMGVRSGLSDLLSGWNEAVKVIFVLFLIMGAGMLTGALMATSPVIATGYTRAVLSMCTCLCTCVAGFMLIVDLSVLMGSYGYIAGIILGLVAVLFGVSLDQG